MTNPFGLDGYGTARQPSHQQSPAPGYPQQYPAMYAPPQRSASTGWLLAIIAILLAAIVGIVAYLVGSGSNSPLNEPATGQVASRDAPTSTVVETQTLTNGQETPTAPGADPASRHIYTNYAADTDVTSGPFAANVYDAFIAAYRETGTTELAVSAYSPATGKAYTMSCAGGSTVYCSGGNNARVRIW